MRLVRLLVLPLKCAALLAVSAIALPDAKLDPGQVALDVDNDHTTIAFTAPILHGLSAVEGKFLDYKVNVTLDEKDLTHSSVNAVIKTTSVDTNIAQRDRHLRSSAFFDVAKYPEMTFKSSEIKHEGDHYLATGDFFLHGVTKKIAIPFTPTGTFVAKKFGLQYYGYEAHLKINRKDYGMNWMHEKWIPEWVADVIQVDLHVFATKPIAKSDG